MITQIFIDVLIRSLLGTVIGIPVYFVRRFTRRRFGAAWQYYLWIGIALIMLFPAFPKALPNSHKAEVNAVMDGYVLETVTNISSPAQVVTSDGASPERFKLDKTVVTAAGVIWLSGFALSLLVNLVRYAKFSALLRKNSQVQTCFDGVPKSIAVRSTGILLSPILVGAVRPSLYLPETGLDYSEKKLAVAHELTHYKRRDVPLRWLVMFCVCVHWFNPFCRVLKKQIFEECEVSCDEAVAKNLGESERENYMKLLLSLAEKGTKNSAPLVMQMSGSAKMLVRRLEMIRNTNKRKTIVVICSLAAAASLFTASVLAGGRISGAVNAAVNEVVDNSDKSEAYSDSDGKDKADGKPIGHALSEENAENPSEKLLSENAEFNVNSDDVKTPSVDYSERTEPVLYPVNSENSQTTSENNSDQAEPMLYPATSDPSEGISDQTEPVLSPVNSDYAIAYSEVNVVLANPVISSDVSAVYGERHDGIDFSVPTGTEVMAAQSGTVLKSEYDTKLGNYVVLQHENGVITTYAHGSELLVNEGDSVDKGETVLLSGSTGYSTGPHLHFGVSVDGKSVDPANYIIIE